MPRKKAHRKLPNGKGSITKLGKTSSGKERVSPYMARLPAYYDSNGKEIRHILGCYKTYEEAFDALMNFDGMMPTDLKLIDVYNLWKKDKYFNKLSIKSQERYDRSFKRFERLHGLRITDIKLNQLQNVVDEMITEGYINSKGEEMMYTYEYVTRLKIVITKIYDKAIDLEILKRNLGKSLEVDGRESIPEKQVFSISEINQMFDNAEKYPFLKFILIMIYTGMRPGEFRGLRVSSIDFKRRTISNFGIKTKKGKTRVIVIHDKIYRYLYELAKLSETGYIYEKDGQRVSERTFYDDYYKTLDQVGLPSYLPKSCRSTFATLAHVYGMNDLVAINLMGHEDLKTTNDNYIDDYIEYLLKEVNKID